MNSFEDKVVLVTGGSAGIGRASCRAQKLYWNDAFADGVMLRIL